MLENKKRYIDPSVELIIINIDEIILTSGQNKFDPNGILDQNGDPLFWYNIRRG